MGGWVGGCRWVGAGGCRWVGGWVPVGGVRGAHKHGGGAGVGAGGDDAGVCVRAGGTRLGTDRAIGNHGNQCSPPVVAPGVQPSCSW